MNEIISAPDVGDGNPGAAIALERLAEANGIEVAGVYELPFTSGLVNRFFHASMTRDPEQARDYTNNSEAKRAGIEARAYGRLSFAELARAFRQDDIAAPARWNTTQEHALLGASPDRLRRLGIEAVRLFVPDVYPKESGVSAAKQHDIASLSVWNRAAFEALSDRGVPVRLTKPYLLEGFRPAGEDFQDEGVSVVAKSSGSGIPAVWEEQLLDALGRTGQDWALHTPAGRTTDAGQRGSSVFREERLQEFYDDLGGRTRAFIGYPSELVGVACELRERGVPVWMLTLPPRGEHEKRNLRFGLDHGIIRGELALPGAVNRAEFRDLEAIALKNLPDVIANLETPDWQPGIIGTEPVWRPVPAEVAEAQIS